jgi:hypothetical protein
MEQRSGVLAVLLSGCLPVVDRRLRHAQMTIPERLA